MTLHAIASDSGARVFALRVDLEGEEVYKDRDEHVQVVIAKRAHQRLWVEGLLARVCSTSVSFNMSRFLVAYLTSVGEEALEHEEHHREWTYAPDQQRNLHIAWASRIWP